MINANSRAGVLVGNHSSPPNGVVKGRGIVDRISESRSLDVSLDLILGDWLATLFAYQPDIYFQIERFRRGLSEKDLDKVELHNYLISSKLLTISGDAQNLRKIYLVLDSDLFTMARGKVWTVTLKKRGKQVEFSCIDQSQSSTTANRPMKLH